MKYLLNGCSRSEISVTPKNWNTAKASLKKPWKIHYRFYDPAFKDHPKHKGKKQIAIRGMNDFHTLADRQASTRDLMELEKQTIDIRGFNPISEVFMAPAQADEFSGDVTSATPFIIALQLTLRNCISEDALPLMKAAGYDVRLEDGVVVWYKDGELVADQIGNPVPEIDVVMRYVKEAKLAMDIQHETVIDCKSVLKYFGQSASMLKKDWTPLREIKSKDVRAILDNCKNLIVERVINKRIEVNGKSEVVKQKVNGKMVPVKSVVKEKKVWNDNQFNHYRSYLGILFSKLKKQEILEYNLIDNIDIRDTTPENPDQEQRKVLTPEQRQRVHDYTKEKLPEFNRFINIFFHSGARRTEMMRVQGKHVDIPRQRFAVLIKKRKKWTWDWKTIKDVALPYWIDAIQDCGSEDYVFSLGLKPGPRAIRPEQTTRRWRRHIKNALDVDSRFYDLKHLHTTELVDLITDEIEKEAVREAAKHNSHTTDAMVVSIYDVKTGQRKHNKVRAAGNSFAK